MKRFDDLSDSKKEYAVHSALQILFHDLLLRSFKVDNPDLQRLVDEAFAKTNQMRAEWRGSEWLYDNHRDRFEPIARIQAAAAWYPERDERVIGGIA